MIYQDAILERLFQALAASSELRSWFTSRYGAAPVVALGWDVDTESELRETPAIVLAPGSESRLGCGNQPLNMSIRCQVLISESKLDEPPVSSGVNKATRRLWPARITQAATVVRSEIISAMRETNAPVDDVQLSFELLDWPVVCAVLTVNFAFSSVIGEQFLTAEDAT